MHAEAMDFLTKTIGALEDLASKRVLEIGSYDVNGSARALFPAGTDYVGIDRVAGPGVDWQVDARWFDGDGKFDVAITTETLEHDVEPQTIIDCAGVALRSGGLLIITAAGLGREPHGDHGGPVTGDMYFGVIEPNALKEMLSLGWYDVTITEHKEHCDVYATAKKAG